MAITVTNQSFNKGKNLAIIFQHISDQKNITTKSFGDFTLIFANDKIVGINVFNYQKYFVAQEGFHLITNEIKDFLMKKFTFLKPEDFVSQIKVGKIDSIKDHPNNSRLKILEVNFSEQVLQIITNVQDLKVNNYYVFALAGAVLASGLQIQNTKVMNVESQGMIVSYQAIGINKSGLINFDDYQLNQPFEF